MGAAGPTSRGAAEAALVDDVVFQEGGASRTEAEFDLARAGYFPRACDVLREGWMANGTDGAARAETIRHSAAVIAASRVARERERRPGCVDACGARAVRREQAVSDEAVEARSEEFRVLLAPRDI